MKIDKVAIFYSLKNKIKLQVPDKTGVHQNSPNDLNRNSNLIFDWRGPTSGPQRKWGFKPKRANPTRKEPSAPVQPTGHKSEQNQFTTLTNKKRDGGKSSPVGQLSCQLQQETPTHQPP